MGEGVRSTVGQSNLLGDWRGRVEARIRPDGDASSHSRTTVIIAVNATPDGGTLAIEAYNLDSRHLPVSTQVETGPAEYVCLTVRDTGLGSSPEVAQRVFGPFFTTEEVAKWTGLGVAMVYGFVKQSKGHVSIESEVGVGTTVRILLPRSPSKKPVAQDQREEVGRGAG